MAPRCTKRLGKHEVLTVRGEEVLRIVRETDETLGDNKGEGEDE